MIEKKVIKTWWDWSYISIAGVLFLHTRDAVGYPALCKKNGCQNPGGWRASSVTWGHDARSSWIRETLLHRVNYKNLTAKDNSQTNTVIEYFFVLSIKVVFYYYPSHNRKFSFKKFLLVPEIFPRISIKSDCIFITVKKKTHKPDTKKQWFRKNLWT